jgi:hypothetical protein
MAAQPCSQGHAGFSVYEEARGMTDEDIIQKAYAAL